MKPGPYNAYTIKEIFDRHCSKLKIDAKLIKSLKALDVQFVTKNSDHINFFGSGLLGVYPIKWLDADRDEWIDNIMQIDDVAIKDDLYDAAYVDEKGKIVKYINPEFKVISDITNLSMVYLIHRILTERSLPQSQQREGAVSICKLLHYKFISSLLSNYFEFPANENVAKATYNSLSMQFMIKQLGTWGALITARSEDAVGHTSIHYKGLLSLPLESHTYFLSDTQTRIRNVVKAQTREFYLIHDSNNRSVTTSQVMQVEDGIALRGVNRDYTQFQRYLLDLTNEPDSFVKLELVQIITEGISSADPKAVQNTLLYLCANINDKRKPYISELVNETIIYALDFIQRNKIPTTDLALVIEKLKAMLVGSRVTDPKIINLRKLGDRLVKDGSGRKSSVPTQPERVAVVLYIVLRTLTMRHYR